VFILQAVSCYIPVNTIFEPESCFGLIV
jgi:hypothetical protein